MKPVIFSSDSKLEKKRSSILDLQPSTFISLFALLISVVTALIVIHHIHYTAESTPSLEHLLKQTEGIDEKLSLTRTFLVNLVKEVIQ